MGILYVVATPIGNLEDLTLRALRILGDVGLIAAEDTRTTRKLLARYGLHVPLLSYNEHNAAQRVPRILRQLESMDVALESWRTSVRNVPFAGSALAALQVADGIPEP